MVDRDEFHRELDRLTEHAIRAILNSSGGVWNADQRKIAEEYLLEKEAARQRESNADAFAIAKSNADAAWESAKAARASAEAVRGANWLAGLALVVSVISLILSAQHTLKSLIDAAVFHLRAP